MQIPLATSIETRDGSLSKGAKLVNCFVDLKDGASFVVKRPGLRKSVASAAGAGLGMVSWEGYMYHAAGSTFYQTSYASIPSGIQTGGTESAELTDLVTKMYISSVFTHAGHIYVNAQSGLKLSADGQNWLNGPANYAANFSLAGVGVGNYPLGNYFSVSNGTHVYGFVPDGIGGFFCARTADMANYEQVGKVANSSHFGMISPGDATGFVIWDGTRFVCARSYPNIPPYSSDITITTSLDLFNPIDSFSVPANQLRIDCGMVYVGGKYFCVSQAGDGYIAYSSDLGTWQHEQINELLGWTYYGKQTLIKSYGQKIYALIYKSNGFFLTLDVVSIDPQTFSAKLIYSDSISHGANPRYILRPESNVSGGMFIPPAYDDRISFKKLVINNPPPSFVSPPYSYAFTTATPGMPFSWVGTSPGALTKKMFIKNEEKAWTLTLGTPGVLTQVTDADYPAKTVPGAVYLDGYFFVMDKDGTVYNSDLENPDSWNALNYITAEAEWDKGVAIAKHQNYVVALKDWTCELFYDAANPTGSPLAKVSNATIQIGCAQGYSAVQFHGGLIFMSKTRERGRSVHFFPPNSIEPQEIASASIQRILNAADLTTVRAWGGKLGGRILYVLNLVTANISLVYDFTSQTWAQWTSDNAGTEGYFKYGFYATDGNRDFLLHETTGEIFTLTPDVYQDDGADIKVLCRTKRIDTGGTNRKTMRALTVVGDELQTAVSVSLSDDDYQTFSTPRDVSLSTLPPRLLRLGMFRSRSFDVRHVDNTPLRLARLDADIEQAR